jgi:hypothetical protein
LADSAKTRRVVVMKTTVHVALGRSMEGVSQRVRRRGRERMVEAEKWRTRRSEGWRERWSSKKDWIPAARVAVALRIPEGMERRVWRVGELMRNTRKRRWKVKTMAMRAWVVLVRGI